MKEKYIRINEYLLKDFIQAMKYDKGRNDEHMNGIIKQIVNHEILETIKDCEEKNNDIPEWIIDYLGDEI